MCNVADTMCVARQQCVPCIKKSQDVTNDTEFVVPQDGSRS